MRELHSRAELMKIVETEINNPEFVTAFLQNHPPGTAIQSAYAELQVGPESGGGGEGRDENVEV